MSSVRVVETGNKYGNMNTAARFYPEGLSAEERKAIFLDRRMRAGEHFEFDGHKMFMADQKHFSDALKSGKTHQATYFEITSDYVEANPDGWSDIDQDILMVTDRVPGVVIGHPVADCPVVMMADFKKGVMAIGHCSAQLIDQRLPMMVADALVDAYSSNEEDIIAYVGACASDNWTYDIWPKFATDKAMWQDAIYMGEDNLFHIDMRKVIFKQLAERKIASNHIVYSPVDTITNPNYYSNSASRNNAEKAGRNFSGAFFMGEEKIKEKVKEKSK